MRLLENSDAIKELIGDTEDDTLKPLQTQGFTGRKSRAFFFERVPRRTLRVICRTHLRRVSSQQIRLSSSP